MGTVRPLRREDLPRVAALWLRVYRGLQRAPDAALLDYFHEIFFRDPGRDESLPSLVHETRGALTGFMGVLARRMSFRGRPIRAAIATQLMVEPGAGAYAAAALQRRFFAGPQDLSYSDGANEDAERLWRSCGGEVASLYNLTWMRVLRPMRHLRALLERRPGRRRLGLLLLPVEGAFDGLFRLADRRLTAAAGGALHAEEATLDSLAWCLRHLGGEQALRPEYEPGALQWLLSQCAQKRTHGTLRQRVLRTAGGEIAGWFLYYGRAGCLAQVLSFGGRPAHIDAVLRELFLDAAGLGAAAVSGGLEPRHLRALARSHCTFTWPGYVVLARAACAEIAAAVHRGDALLSRLDGEWWARFSDPVWSGADAAREEERLSTCAVSQAS
jgi:hypothetical protein